MPAYPGTGEANPLDAGLVQTVRPQRQSIRRNNLYRAMVLPMI